MDRMTGCLLGVVGQDCSSHSSELGVHLSCPVSSAIKSSSRQLAKQPEENRQTKTNRERPKRSLLQRQRGFCLLRCCTMRSDQTHHAESDDQRRNRINGE